MKRLLLASVVCIVPFAAFAQAEGSNTAAEAAAREAATMQALADMICNQNPYTEQANAVTGEKTGPMELDGTAPQVLADHYGKPYTVGGQTYNVGRVIVKPYEFETTRNGVSTGKRREHILILYAGEQGGG